MNKAFYNHYSWAILVVSVAFYSCGGGSPQTQSPTRQPVPEDTACITRVLAQDDSLGKARNHACESISLSETIRRYADGLQQIDFGNCPPGFSAAFETHRQAWLQMLPLVEQYPDLRGEMHMLFDQLEKGPDSSAFNPLLKNVWDTWDSVEAAMKR